MNTIIAFLMMQISESVAPLIEERGGDNKISFCALCRRSLFYGDMGNYDTFLIVGSDLYNGGWPAGTGSGEAVGRIHLGVAAVDVGTAVLTAEHSPLGENAQSVQRSRPIVANYRIGDDFIVEGHVDTVVAVIERYRLYIYVCAQQLGTPYPCADAGFQNSLGAGG